MSGSTPIWVRPIFISTDGKVSVIDWETARRGPALQDLLYLVADWTAAVTGRTSDLEAQQNFRSLYCEDAPGGTFFDSVHQEIADYMRRTGIATSLFPSAACFYLRRQGSRACPQADDARPLQRESPRRKPFC